MHKLAAAMAAMIALTSMVTVPAHAQRFGIFFGDQFEDFAPPLPVCLSDRQIRQAVAAQGYSNISLNVPDSRHVQVRATKGAYVYLLDFNYCTGRIEERQRLRPAG